jgi:hypothetical protein
VGSTKPSSSFVSFISLFPVPLLCSVSEVIQGKPENGLDLEAKEKPVVEGPVDLGSDRGEGRGGLDEGWKSVLEPMQSGGCGARRGWLAGDNPVQAGNRSRK